MTEAGDSKEADQAREYWWTLAGAIILSCATLASAWCGYQAASWGGVYSTESRTANTARLESARQSAIADRQLVSDVMLFTAWAEAAITEQQLVADELADRFQDHFRPAFDRWVAGPVIQGHLPEGSPFDLEMYVLPTQQAADDADVRATEALTRADEASAHNNRYVLSTVLFASVLFLAGIASKVSQRRIAHAVVVLAGLTLAAAIVVVITLPVHL